MPRTNIQHFGSQLLRGYNHTYWDALRIGEEDSDFREPAVSEKPEHAVLEAALADFCIRYITPRALFFRRLLAMLKNKNNIKSWKKSLPVDHAHDIIDDASEEPMIAVADAIDDAPVGEALGIQDEKYDADNNLNQENVECDLSYEEKLSDLAGAGSIPNISDNICADLTSDDRELLCNMPSKSQQLGGFAPGRLAPFLTYADAEVETATANGRRRAVHVIPAKFR